MKRIICFVLFILIINLVSAFDSIYDDYVYEGDTFQVEGDIYYGVLTVDQNTLILHKNTEVFYIRNGSCEDTTYYQYCFQGLKLDIPDYGRWNQERFRWDPAIHVQIFSKKPSVTITRAISESTVNYGEKATITVEIENTGELKVTDVVFEEIIPEGVDILTGGEGALQLIGRTFRWEGSLYPGISVSFSYSVRPKGYESATFNNATFSYWYEELETTQTLSSLSLSVKTPFTYSESLTPATLSWGDKMTYTMTLTNDDEKDRVTLDFFLQIPENFIILEYPLFLFKSHEFTHRETLGPGKSFSMSFKFKSDFAGDYNIFSNNTLTIRDEVYPYFVMHNVSISIPEIVPEITLSKSSVNEGGPYTVFAFLENPAGVTYYDLTGTLMSPLFQTKTMALGSISAGKKENVFQEQFNAVPVDDATTYNVTFRGRYRTPNFQFFDFFTSKTITVEPVTAGFSIIQDISPKEVFVGEEVTVKVSAKNLGQGQITVFVEDVFPDNMELTAGKTEKSLTLGPDQQEEFYIYKIMVPADMEKGRFLIKTMLNYEDLVREEVNTTITVKKNVTEEKHDILPDIAPKKQEPEKKKGFFRKLWDFFSSFFE